jgi:hypothetical protein
VLKHRKAWTHFLGRIQHGALKIKVVDQKGAPYQDAVISVSTIKHVQGERDFKTNSAGNFFKVLEAGKYEITSKLPDGREAKMEVTTMGAAQEVTIAL